ncbi:ribonuclease E/G [Nereida sp. MMG025]|uniref:ribonuclease E/G n=1 Tax=Nereida sp. MMG025 TaxID=2909981 RepID=UPI001F2ED023|nr:ribonuclease E/G [Nereida sp. MMG025]MCF6443979.1 ribonuclease E/G [Nereida sp. MMG025]
MKGRQIALDHLNGREAAALLIDGRLHDLLVDGDAPRVGTIYAATADRPMKGQGGLFVNTPDGKAFLRGAKPMAPGAKVLVQVTGHAEDGKAIPVTAKVLFKSRYAIVTPNAPGLNVSRSIRDEEERVRIKTILHDVAGQAPHGIIMRSACLGADDDDIADDILAMLNAADTALENTSPAPAVLQQGDAPHALAWREWTEPADIATHSGSFEDCGVLDQLEGLQDPQVRFAQASMFIEPTRALVAVDVNTGGDTSAAAGLRANLWVAKELPRQLRLRGLGGQIVIDFAPMSKADRRQIESSLRAAFKADGIETALVGWTPLGHFELQRKRERLPLLLEE